MYRVHTKRTVVTGVSDETYSANIVGGWGNDIIIILFNIYFYFYFLSIYHNRHVNINVLIKGVTILLSLTVFLNMVAETMPATSDAVPLLGNARPTKHFYIQYTYSFYTKIYTYMIYIIYCNNIFYKHFFRGHTTWLRRAHKTTTLVIETHRVYLFHYI